jgi:hypothetical protein
LSGESAAVRRTGRVAPTSLRANASRECTRCRHCEERKRRSNRFLLAGAMDCFASLAMTAAITAVFDDGYGCRLSDPCAAALRRQSRHRQSSPSIGIGRRSTSSAHQHGPAKLQVNSVPHREQARRREGVISNRFVINRTQPSPRSSCRVHPVRRYQSNAIYAQHDLRKVSPNRFRHSGARQRVRAKRGPMTGSARAPMCNCTSENP